MLDPKALPSSVQNAPKLHFWLGCYFAFIVIAVFTSYYLNVLPPPTSALNNASYIASTVNHPSELPKNEDKWVSLPDMQTAQQLDRTEGWYKLPITDVEGLLDHQSLGLYVPTLNLNIEVFLNDRWLGNGGRMQEPVDRNFNNPLIFNFSNLDLSTENNAFYIHIKGLLPRWTYLGEVYVAPQSVVQPVYEKQKLLRVNLIIFTTIALVFTSLFTAFLWLLRRKRSESYYLWYSVAEMLWAIHDANLFIKRVPFSDTIWESLVTLTIGWSILCFMLFIHRYTGQFNVRTDRWILRAGVVLSLPFAYQELEWVVFYGYQVWLFFILGVGAYGGVFMLHHYMKTKDRNVLFMLLACLVMIAFGVHDLLATQAILPPSSPYIMSISALLIILVISSLLIRRFVASLDIVEDYNESLKRQVLEKSEQLQQEYQKGQQLRKQQILSLERERIMRDIHDGIGGQLITTLAVLDNSGTTLSQVKDSLQIALQDLRMVIDSLDGDLQEITVILGTLRMRLGGLLEQANIELIWRVDDLPMLEEFGPEKSLNTMRIIQEAIANVIKHSGATKLTISAYPKLIDDTRAAVITIEDNGCGIFGSRQNGRGVINMKSRAQKIDADLSITATAAQGTQVKLTFLIFLTGR